MELLVKNAAKALDAPIIAGASGAERNVQGCYIGDLLSRVISKAVPNGVWITIMNNMNVAAVALLADVSCILLAESTVPDDALVKKCDDEGIALLSSDKDAYTLAVALSELLKGTDNEA